jgi:hypothetical protein
MRRAEAVWVRALLLCFMFFSAGLRSLHGQELDVPEGAKVHFMGDSIFRGWGFGQFEYPATLNRIQDITNVLLQDNLVTPPVISSFHDSPPNSGTVLAGQIQQGVVGPDDWIFYEDAGDHFGSYHAYRNRLSNLASAASGANRQLILMTMYDYTANNCCRFDAPTNDEPTKTINDAIRDEAAAQGLSLIDMNQGMDDMRAYMVNNGIGSPMFSDGIHPNVFGNIFMAFVQLRALGANVSTWDLSGVQDLVHHPETGGELPNLANSPFSFPSDLSDTARRNLVNDIRSHAMTVPMSIVQNPDPDPPPTGVGIPLEVVNNSFELGPTFNQLPDAPTPPGSTFGWVYNQQLAGATAGQTLNSFFFDSPASDMSNRHWFTNTNGTTLFQETSHVIEDGLTYQLTGEFGLRKNQSHGFTGANIQLWAKDGGGTLTQLSETVVPVESVPVGSFEEFGTYFTEHGEHVGSTIVIQFEFFGGLQPALDMVKLEYFLPDDDLAGDFNDDGLVDAADYVVWRKHLGSADETSLNGNGDGQNGVDDGDNDLWVLNFGDTDSGASAAAPEPGSLAFALLGVMMVIAGARRSLLR